MEPVSKGSRVNSYTPEKVINAVYALVVSDKVV